MAAASKDVPGGGPIDARIADLESYVGRNEARIAALEAKYDAVVLERGHRIEILEDQVLGQEKKAGTVGRELKRLQRRLRRR